MTLVTVEQAKVHLNLDHDFDDGKVTLIVEQASAILLNYLKKPDDFWDDNDVPGSVSAACLLIVGALYENREGFEGGQSLSGYSSPAPLSNAVMDLVHRYRDPALA